MVARIRINFKKLDEILGCVCTGLGCIVLCWILLMLGGCAGKEPTAASTANAIPAAVQSYEVPIADTSTIPDLIHLRPGQSAILQENLVGMARIPAQGNELYTGPVVIPKGTVLLKPIQE